MYKYDGKIGDVRSRERRDAHTPKTIPKEMKTLFANLAELTAFIREEMNQSVHALLNNILENRLRTLQIKSKCKCPGWNFNFTFVCNDSSLTLFTA